MNYLAWYVATLMSVLGVTYFYLKMLHCEKNFSLQFLIIIVIEVLICSFVKYKNWTYVSVLTFFVLHPLNFFLISHDKFKKVFYYVIVIWIYGAIFDFLSMLVVSLINLKFHFNIYSIWFKVIPSIISLFFFIISAHLRFLKNFANKSIDLLYHVNHSDVLLITFFAFTVVGGTSIALNIHDIKVDILIYILILSSIIIFIFIIHCKNLDYEFDILVKNLKLNNSFYANIDDEYSMFKHNLMAKLLSVKSVSNKKGRILIDELIKDFNSNIDYHKLILDLPYGLDGVINQKLSNYNDKLEIKVSNNLEHDIFELLTPKRYNVLVEKLSLFLDNAIEASLSSIDKVLIINILEESDMIKIEIKNTFSGEIDLDNIGKIHYSTKGKKRGLGLYSILRNNIVSVNFKVVNKYFVGEIMAKFSTK